MTFKMLVITFHRSIVLVLTCRLQVAQLMRSRDSSGGRAEVLQ